MEIIFIILILFLISFVGAVNFYLLTEKKISLKESFRLVSSASALNKLLFTGSGYLASSYFSRNKNLSFHKALSAFLLLEALGVSLWLVAGIYFGAKLALQIPVIYFLPFLAFVVILVWFKKEKSIKVAKEILTAFKNMGRRVPFVIPFILLNIILYTGYYFFLFNIFNFHPSILSIIKIISVSFTVGYLSPSPSGAGFKDAGLVLLLMNAGLTLNTAFLIAFFDRAIVTVFWAILGLLSGYDLIKEEIRRRFKKKHSISE